MHVEVGHMFCVSNEQLAKSSSKFYCLPGCSSSLVCLGICVTWCVCVCNHGRFPSILMVMGAEERFAAGCTVLYTARELDFSLTMDPPRMGGGVWTSVHVWVCSGGGCLFLKWFEESCEQQVGEASLSSPSRPLCCLFLWASENMLG